MKRLLLFFPTLCVCLSLLAQQKEKELRISNGLRTIISRQSKDSTDIICAVKDPGSLKIEKTPARILTIHSSSKTIIVRIAVKDIRGFLENPTIEFADVLRQPKEELTTGASDLSLNKLNLVHHLFPAINGSTIRASVKEQLLDSMDIDWKGRFFTSGVEANNQTSHASIMATILAGGSNSSPYAVGAAPGAAITSSNFATLLPDADSVYERYNISVQNHSYGTGIENYYGADAKAYDISVGTHPSLVHVFSAGNSGTSTPTAGMYAGLPGAATLTGSFKMAKNIITVGSVDSFNNVVPLSSRGPAYDGRLKPELVAYGEDGSSGAAALTSGTVALVQQAYKLLHQNSLPLAALVKAVLLNSADDVGTKGIDYASGYGSLNAFDALQTIKADHFFENTVTQNETKTFSITVPANTKQLKLTLAWSDTAAQANASRALVNDIDAVVKLPATGASWQPWVLSHFPHKDSLLLPAVRKRDTLNTVEQITIDDPQPGSYLLEVTGSRVTGSSQAFALAFQIDSANSFQWTYPTGSDVLPAGSVSTMRWQTNIETDGQIEYSLDGTNWNLIHATARSNQPYFKWLVPDTLSKALLRFVVPSLNKTMVSDTFVISKELRLKIGFNCPDSFLLGWNKLSASNYEIYQLGPQYLEPVIQTADTIKILQKSSHPSLYYAVAPKVGNKTGLRSYTLNYTAQGVECYLRSFFAILQNNNQTLLSAELGSVYNVAEISFQQLTNNGFQTIHSASPLSSLTFSFTDSSLVQGTNFYRLQIKLANGQTIYSPTDQVYYLPGNPVLVFPNPAHHNEPIKIITQEPGKYSLYLYDVNGRLIKTILVQDILQPITLMQLSAGMYFIKIVSDDNHVYHQKLIVY